MNGFLKELAVKRRKFLDGLDANEGAISLGIFEDFYPDEAHFIFELLQNAEDAGATEAAFELSATHCVFEHNGTRPFDERDIDGITGIFNSSKRNTSDKIGKFGVGFKSVFVYTESPRIYSGRFSFQIVRWVMPQEISPKQGLGPRTRFEFPFNHSKKTAAAAYEEIAHGLQQLPENTLLFLRNLGRIEWKIGPAEGLLKRTQYRNNVVQVTRRLNSEAAIKTYWLRFTAPVTELERFTAPDQNIQRQHLAIAYPLEFLPEADGFDERRELREQLKVVPAHRGTVSVFFSAEKETSNLRFHLHAPFVPELSRASIKESPENLPLFEQLATLCAKSLHQLKQTGLLTPDFLGVLPHKDDPLPARYQVIRARILDELREYQLVPTAKGGFAAGAMLYQARAPMRTLLDEDDLRFVTRRPLFVTWAVAVLRNTHQDKLLSSLGIPEWDATQLQRYVEANTRNSEYTWGPKINIQVREWMKGKDDEWHQLLYAVLYKQCEDEGRYGDLRDCEIVRLANGNYATARNSYFPADVPLDHDPLPRVAPDVLNAGSKKQQQESARLFLARMGAKTAGEQEEMRILLETRYKDGCQPPSDAEYLADLSRLVQYAQKQDPAGRRLFQDAVLFKADAPTRRWVNGSCIYLDHPYLDTGLDGYFQHHARAQRESISTIKIQPLSSWYRECGIDPAQLVLLASYAGAKVKLDNLWEGTTCVRNSAWPQLSATEGSKSSAYVNQDFVLTPEARDLIAMNDEAFSRLVWRTMKQADRMVLFARYRNNARQEFRYAPSQLVLMLRELPWVPISSGEFVRPSYASPATLRSGFTVEPGDEDWLRAVGFAEEEKRKEADSTARASKRNELGFRSEEELQRALAIVRLPEEVQERMIAQVRSWAAQNTKLPDRTVHNHARREGRILDQLKQKEAKRSEIRQRSVQVNFDLEKTEARLYLREQYTNHHGEQICQACCKPLPFKLPSGAYYFEAVELEQESAKRYRAAFLSLCPNHAAAYRYANAQKDQMSRLVLQTPGREVPLVLGGEAVSLYFTEAHLADARTYLRSALMAKEEAEGLLSPRAGSANETGGVTLLSLTQSLPSS